MNHVPRDLRYQGQSTHQSNHTTEYEGKHSGFHRPHPDENPHAFGYTGIPGPDPDPGPAAADSLLEEGRIPTPSFSKFARPQSAAMQRGAWEPANRHGYDLAPSQSAKRPHSASLTESASSPYVGYHPPNNNNYLPPQPQQPPLSYHEYTQLRPNHGPSNHHNNHHNHHPNHTTSHPHSKSVKSLGPKPVQKSSSLSSSGSSKALSNGNSKTLADIRDR